MKVFIFILFSLGVFAPQSKSDWIMYPNPARDYFNISTTKDELLPYVKIFDMKGILVKEVFIGKEQTFVRIDINLRPGTYIVYMEDRK